MRELAKSTGSAELGNQTAAAASDQNTSDSLFTPDLGMNNNRECFAQLSLVIGKETSKPIHELSDPLKEPADFLRQVELLKALRVIEATNSLNQCGDVYHGTVMVGLSRAGLPSLNRNVFSVVQYIPGETYFKAIESPEPSQLILIIPQHYCQIPESAIIKRGYGTVLVDKGAFSELSKDIQIIKHPYELTLELIQKAQAAGIAELPGLIEISKPRRTLTPIQEETITRATHPIQSDFERLTQHRCHRAISELVISRSDQIIDFIRQASSNSFRRLITEHKSESTSASHRLSLAGTKISNLIPIRKPNYFEGQVRTLLNNLPRIEDKAALLCRLIKLASNSDLI